MRKGGVDNHNSTSKYAKSLNKEARKKELHKITTENQVCLCTSICGLCVLARPRRGFSYGGRTGAIDACASVIRVEVLRALLCRRNKHLTLEIELPVSSST